MSELLQIERFVSSRSALIDGSVAPAVPAVATLTVIAAESKVSLVRIRPTGVRRIDAWSSGGSVVVHDLRPIGEGAGMCFPAEFADSQLAILWSSLVGPLAATPTEGLEIRLSLPSLSEYRSLPNGVQAIVVATVESSKGIARVITVRHDLGTASAVTADEQSEVVVRSVGALRAWARIDDLLWDWRGARST